MTFPLTPRQRNASKLSPLLGRFIVVAVFAFALYSIARHVNDVLAKQNIATGFDFLWRPARFQIGETLLPFSPTDSYGRALFVALLNTLQVGILGCVLATIVGVCAGVARIAPNPLLRRVSAGYVEVFRNTPVLLQLFFWYAAIQTLPPVRQSLSLFGSLFLSQRGIQIFAIRIEDPHRITLLAIASLVALFVFRRILSKSGNQLVSRRWLLVPVGAWLFALIIGVLSISSEVPRLEGFGYRGGVAITPEFLALLTGLVLYTGAFIAEIVRGGIESIPKTQTEASKSLGLSYLQSLRLVVLPQVFRIVTPPLVSEYLSLVKNSSLAVAIGFPDIVWAANAIINQTGQAIEGILILAGVYLTLSLLASLILNSMNAGSHERAFAAGVREDDRQSASVSMAGDPPKRLIQRLFGTPTQALASAILLFLIAWAFIAFARWGVIDAIWSGTGKDCRAAGAGACWAFIRDKFNLFLFGLYPRDALWRPAIAILLVIAVAAFSMIPRFWGRALPVGWIGSAFLCIWLMGGGFGLENVPTTGWGGLPVTLMLAASALIVALPLSIGFAIARNWGSPSAQMVATGWIEIIRGVPLISILFLSNTLLPLFLPGGANFDKLLRAQLALTAFASAYLAEAVRAGLRAVPNAQLEASQSLALSHFQTLRLVVLPQALRTALPGMVNTAIGIFKDTSLVAIIGLLDLLGAVRSAGRDPNWLGFEIEGYLFAATCYFLFCFVMSRYGLWLESRRPIKALPIPSADLA